MKQQVKELRVKIDGLAQLVNGLSEQSEEIKDSVKSLFLAKAWLGRVLGGLGEGTPYSNDGKRKTVEDIEPAADRKKEVNEFMAYKGGTGERDYVDFNHIEKVDWLREEIQKASEEYKDLWFTKCGDLQGFLYSVVYQHLSEARIHLGFELGRVRDGDV